MLPSHFEPLECRRFLSSSVTNGLLTVIGTPAADHIGVSNSSGLINVSLNFQAESGSPFAGVTAILIEGKQGADTITIDSSISGSLPVSVIGGAGLDSITANGGSGELVGGPGMDTLIANGGQYLFLGGQGNDSLVASNEGNDILRGEAGNDTIYAYNGLDAAQHGSNLYVIKGGAGANDIISSHDTATIVSTSGMDNITGAVYGDNLIWDIAGGDEIVGHSDGDSGADTVYAAGSTFGDLLGGGDQLNPGGATSPPNASQLLAFANSVTDPSQL